MGNLFTQPRAFDNIAWTKVNATVTPNVITDPLGTTTADSLFETTANDFHYAIQVYTSTIVGLLYMGSIVVKANQRTFAFIQLDDHAGNGWQFYINLSTGAISPPASFGSPCPAANVSAFVLQVATGWYRVFFTIKATGTSMALYAGSATAFGVNSFVGNASNSISLWDGWLLQATSQFEMPNPLKCRAKTFDLAKNQLVSPIGSGFVQTIQRAPDMWVGHYETPPLVSGAINDQNMQQFLDLLDGAGNTFLGFDPRKTKPQAYAASAYASEPWSPGGSVGSVAQPLLVAVNPSNSTIQLSNLTAGAQLTTGDMLSYRDANIWRCHRVIGNWTADGSGNLGGMTVTPTPPASIQMVWPAVRLTRACAEMKIIGGIPKKDDNVSDPGPSYQFTGVQYINRA